MNFKENKQQKHIYETKKLRNKTKKGFEKILIFLLFLVAQIYSVEFGISNTTPV